MAEEKIILSVEFPGDIKGFIENTVAARKAVDDLIAANKKLDEQGQKNSKAYTDNATQIKGLNKEIDQNSKIVQANTQAVNNNANSIEALKKRNSELLKERNKVDLSTEEGQKKIKELNAEYDKNGATIKENSTLIEKQRFNIGNYTSALDGISPSLGKFSTGLEASANATGGLTSGIFGMVKASLAFIATPIGALIAALVVAFKALSVFINNSSTGADAFADIMSSIGTVVDIVVDRITALVGGIGKLLSGDFSGGLEDIENSFKGIGDEMEREIKLTLELNAAVRDLEDAEIRHSVAASETENQIKKLLLQSKNRTLSEKERIALLDQAVKLEKKINDEEITNKKKALDIANGFAAQRLDLVKEASETEIAFGKRVLEAFMADGAVQADELRDNVQKAIIELNGSEGSSIAILEKIQNQRDALADKAAADAEKRREREQKARDDAAKKAEDDAKKAADAAQKALDDQDKAAEERKKQLAELNAHDEQVAKDAYAEALQLFKDQTDSLINEKKRELLEKVISQEEYNKEIEDLHLAAMETQALINQEFGEEDLKLTQQNLDYKIALGQKEVDIRKAQEKAKVDAVQNGIGIIASAFNKQSLAYKILATVQTTIDTIRGATNIFFGMTEAIPGPIGIILGAAAAAAATVKGIKAVQEINSQKLPKLAEGGVIPIGGKRHAQGGEVVTVGGRAVAEVEAGENMVILKRGSSPLLRNLSTINQMVGGRDFYNDRAPRHRLADGGFVARAAGDQVSNFQTQQLSEDLANLKIFLRVSDLEKVQNQRNAAKVTSELA